MFAWRTVALLALLLTHAGCATSELWQTHDLLEPHEVAPTRLHPTRIEQAVRTGDGGHHLLVRMSDHSLQHVAIDGVPADTGDDWPPASADAPPAPRLVWSDLPPGVPLAVEDRPGPHEVSGVTALDSELAALVGVDEVDADADAGPRVILEGRRVVLHGTDGQTTTLAEFPPPRPAPPPRRDRGLMAATKMIVGVGARLALTPLALAADVVLGAGVVVGGVFLVPLLW